MTNQEALEWLQRELNHQKYCQDINFGDEHMIKKHQVVIDALTIAADAVSKQVAVKPNCTEYFFNKEHKCACGIVVNRSLGDKYCCECGQKIDWDE